MVFIIQKYWLLCNRVTDAPYRKSTHFWLVRKQFYNGWLWELLSKFSQNFLSKVWLKIFLIDNHYRTFYESLRSKCSSCRLCCQYWRFQGTCVLSTISFITARKRSLGQGNIFSRLCQEFCTLGGWYPSMHCRWYPSMPCRSPGVVSQHALQVSKPTPKGKLSGLAWDHTQGVSRPTPGGSPGPHPGGVSRPTPRGYPSMHWGRPPQADSYCCGWYASYWNAFLFSCCFWQTFCQIVGLCPLNCGKSWIGHCCVYIHCT